jgi:hypothetical protein
MMIAAALVMTGGIAEASPVTNGLAVWLDAGDVDGNRLPDALTDGTPITTWVNKAHPGTNNGVATATPSIENGVGDTINGQPVIRFTGTSLDPDAFSVGNVRDTVGGFHVYLISQSNQTDGVNWQRLIAAYNGATGNDYTAPSWCMLRGLDGSTGTPITYTPRISYTSGTDRHLSNVRLGRDGKVDTEWFDGDMAEVILYDRLLNSAEDSLVRHYLASKYNIAPGVTDRYAGDTSVAGDYDLDVFGIGRNDAANEVTTSSSAGLALTESGDTLDNGEWLLAGHKTPVNRWVSADVPPAVQRSDRVWYLDKTGTLDATLTFDLSEAGLASPSEPNYQLLFSPTSAFAFSNLGLTPTFNGDQISFTVPNARLLDGYYTLAVAPEPSTMLLVLLGLCGIMLRVRGWH